MIACCTKPSTNISFCISLGPCFSLVCSWYLSKADQVKLYKASLGKGDVCRLHPIKSMKSIKHKFQVWQTLGWSFKIWLFWPLKFGSLPVQLRCGSSGLHGIRSMRIILAWSNRKWFNLYMKAIISLCHIKYIIHWIILGFYLIIHLYSIRLCLIGSNALLLIKTTMAERRNPPTVHVPSPDSPLQEALQMPPV